ncbi:MAG: potassium transporter Trk, partial [Cellulosimicrobium cellulans]
KPGRKVAAGFHQQGAPLIRVAVKDVERAGVVRLPRITAAKDLPAGVRTVIWATGYRPAFDWIEGLPLDTDGWPATSRGVVPELPGLYFVGMPFQYALTSGLVGGVGRDAEYVVEHLKARREARTGTTAGAN